MRKIVLLFVSLISALMLSCKNEYLYGDRKILVGSWSWATTHHYYTCFPLDEEWLNPDSINSTYGLEITQKEKAYFFKNGQIQD